MNQLPIQLIADIKTVKAICVLAGYHSRASCDLTIAVLQELQECNQELLQKNKELVEAAADDEADARAIFSVLDLRVRHLEAELEATKAREAALAKQIEAAQLVLSSSASTDHA